MKISSTPLTSGGWLLSSLDTQGASFEGRYYEETKTEANQRFKADLKAHNSRLKQRDYNEDNVILKAERAIAASDNGWGLDDSYQFM